MTCDYQTLAGVAIAAAALASVGPAAWETIMQRYVSKKLGVDPPNGDESGGNE